jgi:hypothetical protein
LTSTDNAARKSFPQISIWSLLRKQCRSFDGDN